MLVVCAGLGVGLLLYPLPPRISLEQMTVENLSRAASSATHNPVQGALLGGGGAPLGLDLLQRLTRVSYSARAALRLLDHGMLSFPLRRLCTAVLLAAVLYP